MRGCLDNPLATVVFCMAWSLFFLAYVPFLLWVEDGHRTERLPFIRLMPRRYRKATVQGIGVLLVLLPPVFFWLRSGVPLF